MPEDSVERIIALVSANPHVSAAIAIVVVIALLVLLSGWLKKRKRRRQSHRFLCQRNRRTVVDGLHSFYLSNPKADYDVTVADLVARDIIKARHAHCPAKRDFSLSLSRDDKGMLTAATVRCAKHGTSALNESD